MRSKKSFFVLALLLLSLSACINNVSKPAAGVTKLPYIDSVIKYETARDGVVVSWRKPDSSDAVLFITKANKMKIAIVAFDKDTSYCYRKINNRWLLSDSFKDEVCPTKMCLTDLNADGYDDIRIDYPVMRGNFECTVLLFDPRSGSFRHNRFYDKMNIGYDSASNLVRASGLGGNFDNEKELYKVAGDSLSFYEGVEMSVSATDSVGELRYYKNVNGSKTRIRIVKESSNKVREDFDKEYWSDELAYFYKGVCL